MASVPTKVVLHYESKKWMAADEDSNDSHIEELDIVASGPWLLELFSL